ncbi:hypothetical protein TRFO_09776 [Tritrichomonas foetus]|uniref:Transcription factor CBF/NF-Y/archaeal histone domain-containing protein n=1 Tax=Tritrichomonas foetus TaxID=1144522 RepID=A0A1J4JCD7_9EUKA|nr:hypothetical protein TRFO_09776 [Tritrichomonas foetus]|eukprot:OHS96866.1 hypothetical protein TRFO_09776 [Tritrichomonas foetus]
MLKANKEVGKFKKGVPPLIVSTAELFVKNMINEITSQSSADEIKLEDIIQIIRTNPQYDFLLSSIDKISACAQDDNKKKKKEADE